VLVPGADLVHRAGQVRAELHGPGPRDIGLAAGGHVLRDAVEQLAEVAALVRPEGGEGLIRPPPEQQGVRALEGGQGLCPDDLVKQRRLPAAEREPRRVLIGAVGRLPNEVKGREQSGSGSCAK
jgi:hypothetical protein